MLLELGTIVTVQKIELRCMQLIQISSREIARQSSAELRKYYTSRWPHRYFAVSPEIEDFEAGQLITISAEYAQLFRLPGATVAENEPACFTIYTKLQVKKENQDGLTGIESGSRQTAGTETQRVGNGNSSSCGVGSQSVSEDGDTVH